MIVTVTHERRARPHADGAGLPDRATGTARARCSRSPGGKGINVARALEDRSTCRSSRPASPGGRTGTRIIEELTSEAILNDFVRIAAESRTSTAVVDPTAGTHTEINEWGPEVTPVELEMLMEKLHYLSRGADFVVLSGSLPRKVDDDVLRRGRSATSTRRDVRVVLDTEGEPLRLGVEAEPFLVSPNQREAEQLVGQELEDDDDFLMALDAIAEMGAAQRPHHARERVLRACFASAGRRGGSRAFAPHVEPVSGSARATCSCAQFLARRSATSARPTTRSAPRLPPARPRSRGRCRVASIPRSPRRSRRTSSSPSSSPSARRLRGHGGLPELRARERGRRALL